MSTWARKTMKMRLLRQPSAHLFFAETSTLEHTRLTKYSCWCASFKMISFSEKLLTTPNPLRNVCKFWKIVIWYHLVLIRNDLNKKWCMFLSSVIFRTCAALRNRHKKLSGNYDSDKKILHKNKQKRSNILNLLHVWIVRINDRRILLGL